MTFTKEQLTAAAMSRIEFLEMMLAGEPESLKERALAIELQLVRMAFAGMEAEPVAYWRHAFRADGFCYADGINSKKYHDAHPLSQLSDGCYWRVTPLYAAPQPATVVLDEQYSERFGWTLGQWAEHVGGRHQGNDPANYYEFGSFMAVAAMLSQFGTVQQKLGWNACRAAMLQGKADGKPELTVWYGPMPESIGKTNWTAMLHRKGQHPWEGITIDCSEYPERTLYEADRMRHLIGELADEPDILAYDADKHSGYVAPGKADGNSPVIPDGWVACSERMPNPNQYVLVCNGVWVGMGMHNDSEHLEDDERWQDEHHEFIDLLHHPVTHWMPLPEAPQQEVKP